MSHLDMNNEFILKTIKQHNKDWMRFYCGYEGDGKTLLACQNALQFNPDFDVATQAIYSLNQLIDFQDIYETTPGKVAFLDEAVLQLLGEESNTKDAKNTKKLFVTHRDRGHIYLLCSPSPWLMTPYIREWRVRDCVVLFTEQMSKNLDRKYGYYSKHEYASFITSSKARKLMVVPADFVKRYKPAFDEPFPMVTDEKVLSVYKEMSVKKLEAQRQLREEIKKDKTPEAQNNQSEKESFSKFRNSLIIILNRLGYKSGALSKAFEISDRQIRNIVNGSNDEIAQIRNNKENRR